MEAVDLVDIDYAWKKESWDIDMELVLGRSEESDFFAP